MATATSKKSQNGRAQVSRYFYPTRIDLPEDLRKSVVAMLNQTLATTTDLKTQVKQAHWNVKGSDFYQLHLLFDEIAGDLEEFIDIIAERVTALAGTAMGTVRMAANQSLLPEYPAEAIDGMDHVKALADQFSIYTRHLREVIDQTDELNDQDTNDLYVQVSRTADKYLWFLEAHLVSQADAK